MPLPFRFLITPLAMAAVLQFAQAADPQPYTVDIESSGEKRLDSALNDSSTLVRLRDKAPAGPFALVIRAKEDEGRLKTALESFGYYQGRVRISIDGVPAEDPTLPGHLSAVPAGQSVEVRITFDKGPQFHLRRVTVEGAPKGAPLGERLDPGIAPGQPAIAADVLAAQARMLTALQESGYALAKVASPDAVLDPASQSLDVTFKVETGPRATIGTITLAGLQEVSEDFVRRRLLIRSGELYRPGKIEKARQDLAATGVFSGVEVRASDTLEPGDRVHVIFDFKEGPKHGVKVTTAFSTDLGGSLTVFWTDRNLFGEAERLTLSASGNGLGGTANRAIGYDLSARLVRPDFLRRDQSLEFDVAALKQSLEAYDQTAFTAGTSLHRKLDDRWQASAGVSVEQERIVQEGVTRHYRLLGLPLSAVFDSTGLSDPLREPARGIRAALTATPTGSFGNRRRAGFVILQANGSTYLDLSGDGRSVLALRGLVGSVQGASQFDLPPDQRFYGGGSGTVRGFKYQSVGPQFPDGNPQGGTAIDAGTVEFRQRVFDTYGVALFVDAGQVSTGSGPFQGSLRVGAGLGLRYYTALGPLRLDFALPVNRPRKGDTFELYLGLGQAF